MTDIDLYKVLGLSQNCTPDQVSEAYHRLLPIWQKQLQDDPKKLAIWMKLGAHAFETLSDPQKKSAYDTDRQKKNIPARSRDSSAQRLQSTSIKNSLFFSAVGWIWDTIWGVVGPILRVIVRLAIITIFIWLLFFSNLLKPYRDEAITVARDFIGDFEFISSSDNVYDSLRCEKARLRVIEAEKVVAKFEEKLKQKEITIGIVALGSLVSGDGRKAAGALVEGSRLTAKERSELERAQLVLRSKVIDDLECFTPPNKN